eukprot:SAG31_NODE_2415_length_5732_cov_7.567016_10_plen_223_part_00
MFLNLNLNLNDVEGHDLDLRVLESAAAQAQMGVAVLDQCGAVSCDDKAQSWSTGAVGGYSVRCPGLCSNSGHRLPHDFLIVLAPRFCNIFGTAQGLGKGTVEFISGMHVPPPGGAHDAHAAAGGSAAWANASTRQGAHDSGRRRLQAAGMAWRLMGYALSGFSYCIVFLCAALVLLYCFPVSSEPALGTAKHYDMLFLIIALKLFLIICRMLFLIIAVCSFL